MGAARLHLTGDFPKLLPRLDGTRAGHHADMPAADRGTVDPHDGVGRAHLAARQLERLEDRHHALHALQCLEGLEPRLEAVVADGADNRPLLAPAHLPFEPERLDAPTDVVELSVSGPWLQYDDHLALLPAGPDTVASPEKQKGHAAGPSARGP